MISLQLNGEHKALPTSVSVAEALQTWGYAGDSVAVAVNGDFVPRSQYREVLLREKDCVDVVAPIQGG